ncbi:hypothetical protein [Methylopila sp. 73B]|uniref:hypothetical protein n=1 Tax=Methylopila sp. 73B TaxID=1120792 RepID=UPI000360EB23|nr:hypothetical protein [Methylopila sp. 73B]
MPETKRYSGACHRWAVRFDVETDLAMVTAWNCPICAIKGLNLAFAAAEAFTLETTPFDGRTL